MSELNSEPVRAVTLSFEEFSGSRNDEVPLARAAAKMYGAVHCVRVVRASEFRADLANIVEAMDQPSIDGINTWFVSKAARELGLKVAVSGLGGDELLGGYPSFDQVPALVARLRHLSRIGPLGKFARVAISMAQKFVPLGSPKLASVLELGGHYPGAYMLRRGLFMPWELNRLLGSEMARAGLDRLRPLELIGSVLEPRPSREFSCVASLESSLYMRNQLLRDTDWASMAHSLEVRVPLVDHVLLSARAPLIGALGKHVLATAPKKPIPVDVMGRAKTGFSTPIANWLRDTETSHIDAARRLDQPLTSRISRAWAIRVAALWKSREVGFDANSAN